MRAPCSVKALGRNRGSRCFCEPVTNCDRFSSESPPVGIRGHSPPLIEVTICDLKSVTSCKVGQIALSKAKRAENPEKWSGPLRHAWSQRAIDDRKGDSEPSNLRPLLVVAYSQQDARKATSIRRDKSRPKPIYVRMDRGSLPSATFFGGSLLIPDWAPGLHTSSRNWRKECGENGGPFASRRVRPTLLRTNRRAQESCEASSLRPSSKRRSMSYRAKYSERHL